MDSLKDKLAKVKDEHAAELVDKIDVEANDKKRSEVMFMLGRIRQVGHDARSIHAALSSQEIRALEHFQQEKGHEVLGYTTFVDFLEKSEYSPMSKHQFYERAKLLNEHGDEVYDLLTSVGISVRASKLLGKGDIEIKGDRLVIGDREIDASSGAAILKDAIVELCDERRNLENELARSEATNQKQKTALAQGQKDFDELQRNLDAMKKGDPFVQQFARVLHAMTELCFVIGQQSDERRAAVAVDWSKILANLHFRVTDALGSNVPLADETKRDDALTDAAIMEIIAEVGIPEDDAEDGL